jgi:hypothetical protein
VASTHAAPGSAVQVGQKGSLVRQQFFLHFITEAEKLGVRINSGTSRITEVAPDSRGPEGEAALKACAEKMVTECGDIGTW